MTEKKVNSFLEQLKEKARQQPSYGGDAKPSEASMDARTCPNCGAGRGQSDGLTHCAYCGFEFMENELTDGVYIRKKDNSQQ